MAKKKSKVKIYSALEVANICCVVNQTAINWIRNGYLKAFSTPGGQYRVYKDDLIEFLTTRGIRLPEDLLEDQGAEADWNSVIVIDDEPPILRTVCDKIEATNPHFRVEATANNGKEALSYLENTKEHYTGYRIDVISVLGIEQPKIEHLKDISLN